MDEGWVKLYRALLDKPIWKQSTPQHKSILITILLMANHEPNEWEWGGEKFKVQKGEFVTSLESIRKSAGNGVSIQNIRTAIARFKKLEFLTEQPTRHGRLITIINWSSYQPLKGEGQQGNQQTPNKPLTPNKNDKNERIKIYGEFENVKLTQDEFEKLKSRSLTNKIEDLSQYIENFPQKAKKYKSHYATILSWDRKDKKNKQKPNKNSSDAFAV